jgi:hypothetical protein
MPVGEKHLFAIEAWRGNPLRAGGFVFSLKARVVGTLFFRPTIERVSGIIPEEGKEGMP